MIESNGREEDRKDEAKTQKNKAEDLGFLEKWNSLLVLIDKVIINVE
jgi:hypothetical protein